MQHHPFCCPSLQQCELSHLQAVAVPPCPLCRRKQFVFDCDVTFQRESNYVSPPQNASRGGFSYRHVCSCRHVRRQLQLWHVQLQRPDPLLFLRWGHVLQQFWVHVVHKLPVREVQRLRRQFLLLLQHRHVLQQRGVQRVRPVRLRHVLILKRLQLHAVRRWTVDAHSFHLQWVKRWQRLPDRHLGDQRHRIPRIWFLRVSVLPARHVPGFVKLLLQLSRRSLRPNRSGWR
jgi:hypothetical protein